MSWLRVVLGAMVVAAVALAGCGGGGGGGDNSCTPGPSASVTITSTGVSPSQVCLTPGGRVTFTNNDTQQAQLEPESGCGSELNGVTIAQGSSGTVTFDNVETCSYHIGSHSGSSAFRGLVAVTQTGGY